MRIVLDLQGAQTPGSRHRGIGRYSLSLSESMIRNGTDHEFIVVVNGHYHDGIGAIRERLDGLLPQESILSFDAVTPASQLDPRNLSRRTGSECLRENFLASLSPDIVHVTSLFEGLDNDAIISVGKYRTDIPTSVTLYDLIPLINEGIYLENPVVRSWYLDRLANMRRAKLLLAISDSSRMEAIEYLGFSPQAVVNVGTAADSQFRYAAVSDDQIGAVLARYGVRQNFVMYTGGIDHRKNIERLIEAYAKLSPSVRQSHTLAIVCSCSAEDRSRLLRLARSCGLEQDETVLTGFVPEDDLLTLYRICRLFVFPSWHEGFGLPALEAMHCGAPVLGSNRSSLPEVIGLPDALFDPYDVDDIADHLERALTDSDFRSALLANSKARAGRFTWDRSGKTALSALESVVASAARSGNCRPRRRRPRLAYVSPLPPQRSGIASYSADILPEWLDHYAVDCVVSDDYVPSPEISAVLPSEIRLIKATEFKKTASKYDRVVYHMGNSDFHLYMLDLIKTVPGVCVQHDYFLSGMLAYAENHHGWPHAWSEALYRSHGYQALAERFQPDGFMNALWKYPSNEASFAPVLGTIAHSAETVRLAARWRGEAAAASIDIVPLMRLVPHSSDRAGARAELGFEDDELVVCSFGIMGETKLSDRLIKAWMRSKLGLSGRGRLVFVGQEPGGEFGSEIKRLIAEHEGSPIEITGWQDDASYKRHAQASDVAVQLRAQSRGETSGAILDCMAHGLPTIINAHGAGADIDDDVVFKLSDDVDEPELAAALDCLADSPTDREALGLKAKAKVAVEHSPRRCAAMYAEAIESFYRQRFKTLYGAAQEIAAGADRLEDDDRPALAEAIAATFTGADAQVLYVDVTDDVGSARQADAIAAMIKAGSSRVEPVCWEHAEGGLVFAREYALRALGLPTNLLPHAELVTIVRDAECFVVAADEEAAQRAEERWKPLAQRFNLSWRIIQDLRAQN